MVLSLRFSMISSFITLTGMSGEKSRVPIAHCLEVVTHGAEVAMQGVSISLAVNSHPQNKGHSITTTTFGDWTHLQENGRDWRAKVKVHLPEVDTG